METTEKHRNRIVRCSYPQQIDRKGSSASKIYCFVLRYRYKPLDYKWVDSSGFRISNFNDYLKNLAKPDLKIYSDNKSGFYILSGKAVFEEFTDNVNLNWEFPDAVYSPDDVKIYVHHMVENLPRNVEGVFHSYRNETNLKFKNITKETKALAEELISEAKKFYTSTKNFYEYAQVLESFYEENKDDWAALDAGFPGYEIIDNVIERSRLIEHHKTKDLLAKIDSVLWKPIFSSISVDDDVLVSEEAIEEWLDKMLLPLQDLILQFPSYSRGRPPNIEERGLIDQLSMIFDFFSGWWRKKIGIQIYKKQRRVFLHSCLEWGKMDIGSHEAPVMFDSLKHYIPAIPEDVRREIGSDI